jgi:hypothetical protein
VRFLSEECSMADLTPEEVDTFSAWWLAMAQEIEDTEGKHLPWPGGEKMIEIAHIWG